jgi:hypothetical protein
LPDLINHLLPRLMTPNQRPAFRDWYIYLRWVDDSADGDRPIDVDARCFLARQFSVLSMHPDTDQPMCPEEQRWRVFLSALDYNKREVVCRSASFILQSIEFDINRRHSIQSREMLHNYWRGEVYGYLLGVLSFSSNYSIMISTTDTLVDIALAAKVVHTIRDMENDISNGMFNIPSEDMASYDITKDALLRGIRSCPGLVSWQSDTLRQCISVLVAPRLDPALGRNLRSIAVVHLLKLKYTLVARRRLETLRRNTLLHNTPILGYFPTKL